jgi:hypothetical protein
MSRCGKQPEFGEYGRPGADLKWRPFQLAFQLIRGVGRRAERRDPMPT